MKPERWPNLVTLFFAQAKRFGDRPFLWAKREGTYQPLTWIETANQVSALARGLRAIGVEPGDRIVLCAENRPEWLIADIAIMAAGAVTVPAYTTNTEADHQHILENSGARGVIVSTERLAQRLLPAVIRSAEARFVITLESIPLQQRINGELLDWAAVMAEGERADDDVAKAAERFTAEDLACLIYTSGTGGAPKGVMLHHGALLHNCAGAEDALAPLGLAGEVYLSYLPLSHAYEHTAGQFFPIAIGAEIYYAEGVETLTADMLAARPTIMAAVPRLYEALHHRITLGVRRASPLKRRLFHRALDLGRARYQNPESLGLGDRLTDRLLDRVVRQKVRAVFGGRLKALVSGGAALNVEIGLFFQALGLPVLQGYGQTEAGPVISVNRPGRAKIHTVGPPLKNVEVRLADDGEILVRGGLVMRGYWENPEATRQVIRDGWLHTGDIGRFDGDGHLIITDRKKDIIVISGGDNISPVRVEGILTLEREIAQAMVYGDRRPHLVALLVPDADWMKAWAAKAGKAADPAALAEDAEFRRALAAVVDRVNAKLSAIEKVRRFAVAPEPFGIDNNQLTPTLKIRRHSIRDRYGEALDALYR
ncbi:MAG: long-chain fatty acid--CoA ligase [Rhodospirillales bacterium]|nr:MAG: long-chain fatty acid--CoA ligase [Rhodospirillales bacterium]